MTYTITVINEVDLIVLNPLQNLEIHLAIKWRKESSQTLNCKTSATLPGYHYTDPHLPSWLHFDQENFTFTGIPPVTSTQYNFTLDIVGVD